jgi:hypothetical protein
MQDLNSSDIEKYVKEKLESHAKLRISKTVLATLADEVVYRASGVFLWVFLVVRSLLEGLQNADREIDLQRRLETFPKDLNSYFRNILDSLDPIYSAQVARGFQVATTARRSLSVMQFWYLDQEEERSQYAIEKSISTLDPPTFRQELFTQVEIMSTRINGRFKGLLEVSRSPGKLRSFEYAFTPQVDFLHRTVKDFLLTSDFRDIFTTWTLDISIIHQSISYASLALLKDLAGYSGHIHSPHGVEDLVTEILTSASEYQTRTRVSPHAIYHELHRTLNTPIAHENALAYWLGTTLRPSAFWAIIGTYRDSCFEWALSQDATEFISSMWPTLSTGLSRSKKLTYLKVAILYRAHRSVKFLAEMEPTVTIVEDDIESLMKYRSKTKATSAIRADELDLMVQTLRTCGVCKRKSHHSFKFVGQLLKAISR